MAHLIPSLRRPLVAVIGTALAGALVLAPAPGWPADEDNAPITVHFASPMAGERGLSRLLTAAAEGNTEETARDIERELGGVRWIRRVTAADSPEVTVHVERRSRTETSRTTDKEGKVTVNHKYRIQGLLDLGSGARIPFAHETSYSESPGSYRDDAAQFRGMARGVASEVLRVLASKLDVLRPNRAEAGLSVRPKYRFLVKGDGLEVTGVDPGGSAERAGLRMGDRIRRIDGEKGTDQMFGITQSWWIDGPGSRHQVEYERDKRKQVVEVELEAPAGRSAASTRTSAAPAARPADVRATAPPSRGSSSAAAGGDVELRVGMTEAELLRALGKPHKKVTFGAKSVWTYEAFTVTVMDGRVSDIK